MWELSAGIVGRTVPAQQEVADGIGAVPDDKINTVPTLLYGVAALMVVQRATRIEALAQQIKLGGVRRANVDVQ